MKQHEFNQIMLLLEALEVNKAFSEYTLEFLREILKGYIE